MKTPNFKMFSMDFFKDLPTFGQNGPKTYEDNRKSNYSTEHIPGLP